MTKKDTERAEAVATLRKLCRPGTTVYTICRHVSRSGMSRRIDLYIIQPYRRSRGWPRVRHEPRYITSLVAKALGYRLHREGGLIVGGCGMDMGFHLVHNLS